MVLGLAPEYLDKVREYWLELRFDRRRWDQKLDDLERILQSPYFEKSANRFLRAEDFADLGTDGIQEVRGILGVQGDPENSNVDGGPLESTPEQHLASLAEGETWKDDSSLLREVARLETRALRAVAEIAMEQNVLDDAVGMAVHALDFDSMDFGYGGRHRPAIHLNEWSQLEEAKKRIFSQYENGIRNALQVRGLLKKSE